jgi:N utilization substance protein B
MADVLEMNDITPTQLLEKNLCLFKGINEPERNFIVKILDKVFSEQEAIDQRISRNLIGWKLERLMPVDRSLLRMGIAESFFNDQKAIIIDDVIRIAKKYGGEDSYKIINAILDKVIE